MSVFNLTYDEYLEYRKLYYLPAEEMTEETESRLEFLLNKIEGKIEKEI